MARDITFTNVSIQADRGFLLQEARDIIFKNVQLKIAVGDPIILDNAKIQRQ